jgi:hypothetical protein
MEKKIKLYVIGNGFDKAHNIKSGYDDFHKYLQENSNDANNTYEHIKRLLIFCDAFIPLNEKWSNFENALGKFDTNKYVQWYNKLSNSIFNDSQSKQNYIENLLIEFKNDINWCFRKWIQSLESEIDKIKPLLTIDNSALFLTFNYTETLQQVYNVPEKRILHIHNGYNYDVIRNKYDRIKGEFAQYIIGHNNVLPPEPPDISDAKRFAREFVEGYTKETSQYINQNTSFWSALKDIDEIIVLGHSLSEIDFPYFEKIMESIDMNTVEWKISYHGDEEKQKKAKFAKENDINSSLLKIKTIEELCGIN